VKAKFFTRSLLTRSSVQVSPFSSSGSANPLPVGVDKAEWTVVDGEGEDGHVVGVENPVGEPHRLPGGDQLGGLLADLAKHRDVAFLKVPESFKVQVGKTKSYFQKNLADYEVKM
jgi:hypothetical protein